MAMRTALTDEYRRISVPTRVLAGSEDTLAQIDTLRAMASRIPGAALDELPGGHVPSLEAPEATTAAFASLLAAVP
jgi:pimeloyl-ACP methyl ester carboxylesterase